MSIVSVLQKWKVLEICLTIIWIYLTVLNVYFKMVAQTRRQCPTPVILATQKDHSSKPSQANSSQDSILKKSIKKRAGRVVQGVSPEFKS
jgi:hypothetical protein